MEDIEAVVDATCFESDLSTCAEESWVFDFQAVDLLRLRGIDQNELIDAITELSW